MPALDTRLASRRACRLTSSTFLGRTGDSTAARQGAPAFVTLEGTSTRNEGPWRPHSANAFYVDCLLQLAESRGIPVCWILTPTIKSSREQLEQSGVSAAYREFVAERSARFARLTVLDGQGLFSHTELFRDPVHVNRDGAIELSLAVAAALGPRLRNLSYGPRWTQLAAAAERETARYQNLVEDLDQSRSALELFAQGPFIREAAAW